MSLSVLDGAYRSKQQQSRGGFPNRKGRHEQRVLGRSLEVLNTDDLATGVSLPM